MNKITNASPSIRHSLLLMEWILLVILVFIHLANGNINYLNNLPKYTIFLFVVAFASLSFIFPINRPAWYKRLYLCIEILVVIASKIIGFNLDMLLYLITVKSCFLLNRKEVIIIVITTGIAWNLIAVLNLPRVIKLYHEQAQNFQDKYIMVDYLVSNIGGYLAASIFVILLSFVALAEQKNRQQAVALAQEVETLAATLERTRIARDIHDSLGHTLTTLDVQLELAQRLRQHDPDRALKTLDTAKLLASQCLQDVRLAVQAMRQSDFNLNAALTTLVQQMIQNQSLRIRLEVNLPHLPLQTSHQLYCIVQEGLTNIQKHAQASCVKLRGWSISEGVSIELTDDGKGFDLELTHSGFGLRGMQERVQLLGGQINIQSTVGKGTYIQVIIPR